MTTTSAILHCYFGERISLTGAPMTLVELDSVAIWWVRDENLPDAHLKENKYVWLSYRPS
jgi:hypothetical protein